MAIPDPDPTRTTPRPPHRRASLVTGLTVATLALGGCGSSAATIGPASAGSSSAPPTSTTTTTTTTPSAPAVPTVVAVDDEFRTKVLAMCESMVDFQVTHQFADVEAYLHPQAGQLADVAAHLDAQPLNHALLTKAAALGTPTAGAESWAQVRATFATFAKAAKDQIDAAKTADLSRWNAAFTPVDDARTATRDALYVAGFGRNDVCSFLFAPYGGHPG